jgi:hypothetical protein
MCKCIDKAIERGYVHTQYVSKPNENAYVKKYLIKVSLDKKKPQDIIMNNCMWCGESLPIGKPCTLEEIPF